MDRLPQSQVFHGYGLSRKFFQATALTSWTLLADSMTAFTIGLSAIFVQGLGKNFNKSAFWTLFWDYPFGKRMQDHVWLSQLKNSSRLPSWLWQAMYNFQKSAQSSIKIFTSDFCCLFFFRGSVEFASLNESLLNKVFWIAPLPLQSPAHSAQR